MIKIDTLHLSDCTVGFLVYESFRCCTLELPWKFNQKNVSCIPGGVYEAIKIQHHKYKKAIHILHVPNRTGIMIHPGNFTSESNGCPFLGDGLKDIDSDGGLDVTNSTATLQRLWAMLPSRFSICIRRNG